MLLIVGAMVLGAGLASFANFAIGFAVSIIGGTMLFAGIIMTIRTFIAIANALTNAGKALEKVTDYVEDVEEKTFGSNEHKFSRYDNLHRQIEKLQKDVDMLKRDRISTRDM